MDVARECNLCGRSPGIQDYKTGISKRIKTGRNTSIYQHRCYLSWKFDFVFSPLTEIAIYGELNKRIFLIIIHSRTEGYSRTHLFDSPTYPNVRFSTVSSISTGTMSSHPSQTLSVNYRNFIRPKEAYTVHMSWKMNPSSSTQPWNHGNTDNRLWRRDRIFDRGNDSSKLQLQRSALSSLACFSVGTVLLFWICTPKSGNHYSNLVEFRAFSACVP